MGVYIKNVLKYLQFAIIIFTVTLQSTIAPLIIFYKNVPGNISDVGDIDNLRAKKLEIIQRSKVDLWAFELFFELESLAFLIAVFYAIIVKRNRAILPTVMFLEILSTPFIAFGSIWSYEILFPSHNPFLVAIGAIIVWEALLITMLSLMLRESEQFDRRTKLVFLRSIIHPGSKWLAVSCEQP